VTKLLCVVVGGGLGSVLRYLLSAWGQRAAGSNPFPVGTLLVNVLGCLAMGVLGALFALHRGREEWRLLPGDVLVFRGDQRHSYANPGARRAVGYSVVVLARVSEGG